MKIDSEQSASLSNPSLSLDLVCEIVLDLFLSQEVGRIFLQNCGSRTRQTGTSNFFNNAFQGYLEL